MKKYLVLTTENNEVIVIASYETLAEARAIIEDMDGECYVYERTWF